MFTSIRKAFQRVEAALNRFAALWEQWGDECEARMTSEAKDDPKALEHEPGSNGKRKVVVK